MDNGMLGGVGGHGVLPMAVW